MRRLICIWLLLCLPLQGFAMQWAPLLAADAVSITHQIEHDEHVQHHHHDDDDSIHYDDSDESVQHVLDHSTSPPAADLVAEPLLGVPAELITLVVPERSSSIPDPSIPGPQRPPAQTLG